MDNTNIIEKLKRFIKEVEKSEETYRSRGWELANTSYADSQWHFGWAQSCRATINDLNKIIQEEEKL